MDVYSKDQPLGAVRWPHHPESVAAEIVPAMRAEIERLDAMYGPHPDHGALISPEYRRLAELQKGRLLDAIGRWEHAAELIAERAPPGD